MRLTIGDRSVGDGEPVYLIAEAGSNHDGKLEQAIRLVEIAAEAGADAVKFQLFRADDLYPKRAGRSEYLRDGRQIHDIIRELELPADWLAPIARRCTELKIDFLVTPFDERSADAVLPYVPAFKIASYEMTHEPLVRHVARTGKPLIISTGGATLDEVRETVASVRSESNAQMVVMQCTASYPAPVDALNLRAISTLRAELGVLIGLSDHSREPLTAPLLALALGACVIEKHFTLSNDLEGPDHRYAIEPDELRSLVAALRDGEAALGSGRKEVQEPERELRAFARRSIFARRLILAGETLDGSNVAVLRCGTLGMGLHPRQLPTVLGRRAARQIPDDRPVTFDDLGVLVLEGHHVRLRLLDRGDTDAVLRWRADPTVASQLFSERAPSRSEHETWLERTGRDGDRLECVIVERDGDRPLGTIGLSGLATAADPEFGILLGEPDARGRGMAREASELLLDHAFHTLEKRSVRLRVFADNGPALGLYRRLGFRDVGEHHERLLKDGRIRDVISMSIHRDAWLSGRPR